MYIEFEKKHTTFIVLYSITILIMLLDQAGALPLAEVLRKFKYVYIAFVFVLCLKNRFVKKSLPGLIVIGLLFVHTILFGYVFQNDVVVAATTEHANQMMIYLLMLAVTYIYISQEKIYTTFFNVTYLMSAVQLVVSALLHFNNFVNPIWGIIQTFRTTGRYRSYFGFTHSGYLSNQCYFVIVLSIIFYELNVKRDTGQKKTSLLTLIAVDAIAFLMLISSAQRSGVISVAMALIIYFALEVLKIHKKNWFRLAVVALILVACIFLFEFGVWDDIWNNSNRSLNISVNYPVFKEIGNLWTGMGYVESSGFQRGTSIYGITTSSLDMYYVYIFFTTGVIGCILMGLALLIVVCKVFTQRKNSLKYANVSITLSLLFWAYWQVNLFTYRYLSSFFFAIILLLSMEDIDYNIKIGETEQYENSV